MRELELISRIAQIEQSRKVMNKHANFDEVYREVRKVFHETIYPKPDQFPTNGWHKTSVIFKKSGRMLVASPWPYKPTFGLFTQVSINIFAINKFLKSRGIDYGLS